jgi:glycosyltransferase involved in cell wall biosynthesis
VGEGPAQRELQARCPDAVFAGVQRGEHLAAHYASGDMFLFPSLTETYGNVTAEAMASGLAVIAYDYAAAAALIRHGDNGLLAEFGDTKTFAALADGLVGDPAGIAALGAQARIDMLTKDWTRVVQQLESVLEGAAGRSGRYGRLSGERRTRVPMPQRI